MQLQNYFFAKNNRYKMQFSPYILPNSKQSEAMSRRISPSGSDRIAPCSNRRGDPPASVLYKLRKAAVYRAVSNCLVGDGSPVPTHRRTVFGCGTRNPSPTTF